MARPAPLAMIPTDPSRPMYCSPFDLARRSRSSCVAEVLELGPFRMAKGGVVVEGHLGVEHPHLDRRS